MRATLVFAAGSAAVFVVMYALVAAAVRDRGDSWLIGESQTLKQVAMTTPRDALYDRIVEEVAELATQEVAYDAKGNAAAENVVFFAQAGTDGQNRLWVGPQPSRAFLDALRQLHVRERQAASLSIPGWPAPFRVVAADLASGDGRIYLGFEDASAAALMQRLLVRFFLGWLCMVTFGYLLGVLGIRRTLKRVEAITTAAASTGEGDLSSRVPAGRQTDEIGRLARTFNSMLDRISASVNQMRTVTDSVAHDLKSPITSVRGRLEIALSSEDPEMTHELIAGAIESIDHLAQVITTALDGAAAEAGALRVRREPVDLVELVGRMTELYAPAFAEKEQSLATRAVPQVVAQVDLTLVTRVLSNLLENELRYAGAGARVLLTVESDAASARIRVQDSGPGFAPELAGRIFQRFARGQNSGGHGLGLAFIRAVAVAHGGSVTAHNLPEGGAAISICLPLDVSPERMASFSADATQTATPAEGLVPRR